MPFNAREAEATETFARRATVVMVGVSGLRCKEPCCKGLPRTFTAARRCHKIGAAVKGNSTRSSSTMAEIRLEDVTKDYVGDVRAVDSVNLTIASGEFMVLVGPSGCGKSTLLRMIAGLEEITSGNAFIGERDVTNLSPRDRDIAMVFQNYALYPHLTVERNLAYGLRVRRTPKAEITRRVHEVAQMLGLEELLQRRPAALSGGQRQRVAMGRAIVREPAAF